MKNDLSRWDLVDEFTAQQAACLILGFDPNNPDAQTWATEPLLIRMRESYQRTVIGVVFKLREDDSNVEGINVVGEFMELMGRRLMFFYLDTERHAEDVHQAEDAINRLSGWFDQEKFRRPEIARWLSLFEIESQYQFDKDAAPSDVNGMADDFSSTATASDAVRPEKGANKKALAEAIIAKSSELGFDHPRDIKTPKGKTPGPKQKILAALRNDARYSHLPLTLNADGKCASYNAAWTEARKPPEVT